MTRIYSHWLGFFSLLSVSDSVMDFRKNSLFRIIFLPWGYPTGGDLSLFFLSLIMGYGWMDNISLRIILFSILA